MTRKLVFNDGSGYVNGDWDDDDDLEFDADGEVVENDETEMMLGIPSINFGFEIDRQRKDGARFDRQIDGDKPKVTRRRHHMNDNVEDDDEVARPLSMNFDRNGEQLLGVPVPDWSAISRGEPDLVHNDDGEDLLGTPSFDWAEISRSRNR